MTGKEILALDAEKFFELINTERMNGLNNIEIAKKLGIGERTIRTRAEKGGYSLDENKEKYILAGAQEMTEVIKGEKEVNDQSKTKVIEKTGEKKDNSHTKNNDSSHQKKLIKINKDAGEDAGAKALVSISESIQGIKELLEADREAKKSKDIVINLEDEEDTRTTIRVNAGAWKKFESFTLKNSEYKKKDLLSMALLEFIQNHK